MKILLLTTNPGKIRGAQLAFEDSSIEVIPTKNPFPEIQAQSSLEIARHTAELAVKHFSQPIIREDHSFHIHALDGFPGPYMSYAERNLSPRHLLKLLEEEQNRDAHFTLSLVYAHPDGTRFESSTDVPVEIARMLKDKLHYDWHWDTILTFPKQEQTFGEISDILDLSFWRENFLQLKKFLERG